MAVSQETMEKKILYVYKAFFPKPNERLQMDVSGCEFYRTEKTAIAAYLKSVETDEERDALIGRPVTVFKISIPKDVFLNKIHDADIEEHGDSFTIVLKNIMYRMNCEAYYLRGFLVKRNNDVIEGITNISIDKEG
nr:MAG TPA: hypothetical protein [Caudoviricetes sp.]